MIIGTFLPERLRSLAAALKFDGVNPVPDMTKRKTASKLITRGSWPSARKAIVNVSLTRSNTSLKELNLCLVLQGLSLPQYKGLRGHVSGCFFFHIFPPYNICSKICTKLEKETTAKINQYILMVSLKTHIKVPLWWKLTNSPFPPLSYTFFISIKE